MKGLRIIYEDTRQQVAHGDKHAMKHAWWDAHGVDVVRHVLDAGDYATVGSAVVVDTKRSIAELAMDVNRDHKRFKRECVRARDSGLELVVLVENSEGATCAADLPKWVNDHCRRCAARLRRQCNPRDRRGKCPRHGTRKPIQGPQLSKALPTMEERYGVRFMFCRPEDSARIVCDLLGVDYEENEVEDGGGE